MRVKSLVLAAVCVVGLNVPRAFAQIPVSDVLQLQAMKDDLTAAYYLTNDIDASVTSTWNEGAGFEPIGNAPTNSFTGSFDGNGYTITNLYINRPTTHWVGLFGFGHGCTIQNVVLANVNITGGNETGALVGRHRTGSQTSNCSVTGSVSGVNEVGALVGRNVVAGTKISECSAACSVTGVDWVGGLVGYNWNGAEIWDSNATCSVVGNYRVGGLVGFNSSNSPNPFSKISNSEASCGVQGEWSVGGRNVSSVFGHFFQKITVPRRRCFLPSFPVG